MKHTEYELVRDPAFATIFALGADAIEHVARFARYNNAQHRWHHELQGMFALHPLIARLVNLGYRPIDWHQLLLEWPHVSVEDETQIAYTRSEENGRTDRQTRTPIGKYLSRHYPHAPDHMRRDWMLLFQPAHYEIWGTRERIIMGVELGPQSCMKSSFGSIPFTREHNALMLDYMGDPTVQVPWERHPYAVYGPEYGWRIAVRFDKSAPKKVLGRALLNVTGANDTVAGVYVRSYALNEGGSHSPTDNKLEAWLDSQGYQKRYHWPEGLKFRRLLHPKGADIMMPYLDGDDRDVCAGDGDYLVKCDEDSCDSEIFYRCDNTNGMVDVMGGRERIGSCEDCGAPVYEDDDERMHVGRDEDSLIGSCCAHHYTYVEGGRRRGSSYNAEYYVHNDNAVCVHGTYYDTENPPDEIVCCEDGEYRRREDCVEIDDEWYDREDDDIVLCADDEYRLRDDCWESAKGNWYSEDEPSIEIETTGTYHADELQELIDNA